MSDEVCFKPAVEIAALVRNRTVSPVEVTAAFLARIDARNPALNAFVTVVADAALAAARAAETAVVRGRDLGPLHGVPFAVKDLVFTAGVRTTAGSRIYADHVPTANALAVSRLLEAGAILLGKTNTPEFGFKSTTENALFGVTGNPWRAERTAGGSSGGAGAATAAGMAPLSLGTDAGGSIRTPASFCGIVGFKPTFGLVPNGPGFGGARTLAHSGPMTRTVADAALMLDCMAGADQADRLTTPADPLPYRERLDTLPPDLRMMWSADLGYAAVDPDVARLTSAAAQAFDEVDSIVLEADFTLEDPEPIFNTIMRAENYVFARDLADQHAEELDPGMLEYTRNGAGITAHDYLAAQAARDELCVALGQVFERCDLLLTPTLAVPPFEHGRRPRHVAGRAISGMNWLSFTYPFNLTGNPAISVPSGWTREGLPVGLQIIGPRHADALVLQAAAAFEALRPWADRRPA